MTVREHVLELLERDGGAIVAKRHQHVIDELVAIGACHVSTGLPVVIDGGEIHWCVLLRRGRSTQGGPGLSIFELLGQKRTP